MNLKLHDIKGSGGLDDVEVLRSRQKHGENILKPPKGKPEVVKVLLYFCSLFNILLQICSISAFISYALNNSSYDNIYVGTVLYLIVLQDVITNYLQDRKTN